MWAVPICAASSVQSDSSGGAAGTPEKGDAEADLLGREERFSETAAIIRFFFLSCRRPLRFCRINEELLKY